MTPILHTLSSLADIIRLCEDNTNTLFREGLVEVVKMYCRTEEGRFVDRIICLDTKALAGGVDISGLFDETKPEPVIDEAECQGVYVLACRDGAIYTGSSKDIKSRVAAHRNGDGAAFVKRHNGFARLLVVVPCSSRGAAYEVERLLAQRIADTYTEAGRVIYTVKWRSEHEPYAPSSLDY